MSAKASDQSRIGVNQGDEAGGAFGRGRAESGARAAAAAEVEAAGIVGATTG